MIFKLYLLGTVLGTIYSVPPIQLKRFPWCAGAIIATVRGFLLNFGVYYAVREALQVPFHSNPVVVFLASFMTVFASVIAVTKVLGTFAYVEHKNLFTCISFILLYAQDLSDVAGDSKYNINTFATKYGTQRVAALATAVLSLAYVTAMALPLFLPGAFRRAPMTLGHGALLAYFLQSYSNLDGDNAASIRAFYKAIWNLFYLEYVLYVLI